MNANADGVFKLGAVVVKGDRPEAAAAGESVVNRQQIERFGLDTVGEAASKAPDVSLSRNSRKHGSLWLRGFDSRKVPVFVDGIPLYVPYDGNVDFGRFTSFDIASIRIAKGAASLR